MLNFFPHCSIAYVDKQLINKVFLILWITLGHLNVADTLTQTSSYTSFDFVLSYPHVFTGAEQNHKGAHRQKGRKGTAETPDSLVE